MIIKMESLYEGVMVTPLDPIVLSAVASMTALSLLFIYMLLVIWASSKDHIPGPPTLPFFGNSATVVNNWDRLLAWCNDCNSLYGGKQGIACWKFKVLGQPDFIVTMDPSNIERILTKTEIYGKGPIWRRK